MTQDQMRDTFKNTVYDHDRPPIKRPDLYAFNLLNVLVPAEGDIIAAAEHDEIYLSIDLDALAAVITEDQVVDLVHCGVNLYDGDDGLHMFV